METLERTKRAASKTEVPIATKLQILEDIDANICHKHIAEKYSISTSTVAYILKKRKKVEEAAELNEGRKRLCRTTKYQHINNMMMEFYSRCQAVLIPVASPLLQNVSRRFAKELEMNSFSGSNGWCAAFLHRNRITSFAKRGENKEDRKKRMLTEHQLNMVETIVSDIIAMKDRFKDEETAESQYVLVEPQPFPNFFAEPVVVNVAFEPLGTVQLIPHQTSTSLELVDKPDLVVPSVKKSSSSNMKIRTYAQAIQALGALQRYAYEKGSSALLPMLGEVAAVLSKEERERTERKPLNFKKRRVRTQIQNSSRDEEQFQTSV